MPTYHANWVVTTGQDIGSLINFEAMGRFRFGSREQVRSVAVRFIGGSGTAELKMLRHARLDGPWGAREIWAESARGTGADVLTVISPGDARESFFVFDQLNDFVILWTNPDGGNMKWLVEVKTEFA